MNHYISYCIILVVLLVLELSYFKIADKSNIIDKPNERSSHSKIVLRGGGIIFMLGFWVWSAFFGFQYPLALAAVTLAAGLSFVDDIHSLPDVLRLAVQFVAMAMLFYQIDLLHLNLWWAVIIALVVCVGATNIYNFMDGINGITGSYSLAVLVPLLLVNRRVAFVDQSFLVVIILSVLVFCFFNFRPKNKAKCFAGDVGSIGIAFILLFAIGLLVMETMDITWLVFLLVYGVDGCLTICHRIMLHENLGQAHRKHAFQIMANELKIGHVKVSCFYMLLQLAISLSFIYLIPDTGMAHWIYLISILLLLAAAYVLFMKKYYHLHEEYLASIQK